MEHAEVKCLFYFVFVYFFIFDNKIIIINFILLMGVLAGRFSWGEGRGEGGGGRGFPRTTLLQCRLQSPKLTVTCVAFSVMI